MSWNINDLIQHGMDFFTGKTVLKSTLDAAEAKATEAENKVTAANTRIAELEKSDAATKTALTAAQKELATANTELGTRNSELAKANEKITTLEKSQKTVSQTAQEITASQGVPAAQLPESPAPGASGGDLLKQRAELESKGDHRALAAFDAKHGDSLFTQLRAQLRKELRAKG